MSILPLADNKSRGAIPIWLVNEKDWETQCAALPSFASASAKACNYKAKPGQHLVVLNKNAIGGVLFGIGAPNDSDYDPFVVGLLPQLLPAGVYRFALPPSKPELAALAWLLGSYTFTRYIKKNESTAQLVTPRGVDKDEVYRIAEAISWGRDLINTPACDMGPADLEKAVEKLGKKHGAKVKSVKGEKLLEKNFPLIYAVGQAAEAEPRLVTLSWGNKEDPVVTLVGKGVAFDTGGLDIKPSGSMLLMKKDMGGAATALALGDMIMGANLPIRLNIVVPAVENAISSNAFRPGDIFFSRKGISVEVGNTDAEGRLILADALALADEDSPEILIDFATLTGAARVALGPDLPPFFTRDDALADQILKTGFAIHDPVWRLPLWEPYKAYITPDYADLNNSAGTSFAGSITAALFLDRFVEAAKSYVHFDVFAWTPSAKPGLPKGGEIQSARLIYELLRKRYPKK